jgi:hypothetical protein
MEVLVELVLRVAAEHMPVAQVPVPERVQLYIRVVTAVPETMEQAVLQVKPVQVAVVPALVATELHRLQLVALRAQVARALIRVETEVIIQIAIQQQI